tara:strand:+ start:6866 stop:7105 length:240 start_codon:yes stop_codon:yes gene_type:complete
MDDVAFYYIAFFLTIGSFLLGFVVAWNIKDVFDTWKERAEYAAMVMHPEMYEDGNPVDPAELIYLRIHEEDDILNDEDE